ncbi:MAG: right-handed parallel beta-helix repeat-containing protein, partial [Candidatus Heimdallarchaeota archaeon]
PYIISGYTFEDVERHAIQIYGTSKHYIIQNCIFKTSSYVAIEIKSAADDSVQIRSNYFSEKTYAISLVAVYGIIIEDNIFENNRRAIDEQYGEGSYIIRNNVIRHEAQELNDAFRFSGISNTIIENNTFINLNDGFRITNSQTIDIKYNKFIDCSCGFSVRTCSYVNIINNTGNNGLLGLEVSDYCSTVYIENNTFTNYTWYAIIVQSTINCHIIGNNASNNGNYGMLLYNTDQSYCSSNYIGNNRVRGIWLVLSSFYTFTKNIFEDNKIGMAIDRTNLSALTYNTFLHNAEYGLTTTGSYNRTIYNNNFIDNYYTNQTCFAQAFDDGNYTETFGETYWYNEGIMQGNYWSDLVWFAGANYTIDGIIGNVDLYPSEDPIVIPS